MRIVYYVTEYAPRVGGMEGVAKELAERTANKGHDVTVITSGFKGCKKFEKKDNLTVYRLWTIRRRGYPFFTPMLLFKMLTLLKRDTVVHVHFIFDYFTSSIVFLIAKMKRCRIVTHIHTDLPPSGILRYFNPPYKRFMWRHVLPWCDWVICTTQDYINLAYRNKMPANKCILIPLGVDTKLFKPRKSTDIKPPIKVLWVGRLSPEKNIPRLLDAFNLFQAKYEAVLNIVGDGKERPFIEDLIRTNKISGVTLRGTLLGQELSDMYSTSDMFVLTSKNESFGIVNLEAMASGLPVIASDVPGLRDLLRDAAILVKPDPANFAKAMITLVEDSELRIKLIHKGLEKAHGYDWDVITDKVISLYTGGPD